MKRIVSFLLFIIIVLVTQISYAETRLTQPVVDIINSKKFLINFTVTSDSNSFKTNKAVQFDVRNTLVFDGQNALAITDTEQTKPVKMHSRNATLYNNGETYSIISQGQVGAGNSALKSNVNKNYRIIHYVGPRKKFERNNIEVLYKQMIMFFLPLLPEQNTVTDLQGRTGPLNPCTVFSKIGETVDGDQKYQFEEYKTPDDYVTKEVTRYYFQDGKLVSVVRASVRKEIDADENWKDAFGSEKRKIGYSSTMEVFEITGSFNSNCLQVPQGVDIIDMNI